MTPAAVKKFALSLPGAKSSIKWKVDLVFDVGGKMFAVMCEGKAKSNLSFKVDDHRFLELTDRAGIIPAPYMARAKWVQLESLKVLPDAEIRELIKRSHQLVAAKLPKRTRLELGVNAADE